MKQQLSTNTVPELSYVRTNLHRGWRLELMLIAMFCFAFLFINITTSTRYPVVWHDEVGFLDPAANLYFGKGFTSTAYSSQTKGEFWAAYAPLYSYILSKWINLMGFHPTATRSLNYFFTLLTTIAVWLSVVRLNLVSSKRDRLILIALLLLGYGISFVYRSGRADSVMMTLAALAFLSYTTRRTKIRCLLLTCVSIFFAVAGLQLVAFAAILSCLTLIYLKKDFIKECIFIALGIIIGLVVLYGLYWVNGVLDDFITIRNQTISTGFVKLLFAHRFHHINLIPKDPSLFLLIFLTTLLFFHQCKTKKIQFHSISTFAMSVSFILPLTMLILAKFPTYYSWMVFIPLSICVCSLISTLEHKSRIYSVTRTILILVCLIGLPFQLIVAVYDWEDRNYSSVKSLVATSITRNAWVYCDPAAYYAVKERAAEVFLPGYLDIMSQEEKDKISFLAIQPDSLDKVKKKLGGKWYSSGEAIRPKKKSLFESVFGFPMAFGLFEKKYNLQVFKRAI